MRDRYERRKTLPGDQYDLWRPGNLFRAHDREQALIALLDRHGWSERLRRSSVLEVGCGGGENLARLRHFGAPVAGLHGIELLDERVEAAARVWPELDIRQGDASRLPFPDETFDLVLQSTVFTSILDPALQTQIAGEMTRVLKSDGAILWYDFRVNNPWNPDVRGVSRRRVKELFPGMTATFRRVTLIPPLARFLGPRALWLARLLNAMPVLRTHYWALLCRPTRERCP
jgi:ubiquinone/menaquinone biosynthesis C-methylase UbiE